MLVNACDPNNDLPYAFNDQDCADDNANVYVGAAGTVRDWTTIAMALWMGPKS